MIPCLLVPTIFRRYEDVPRDDEAVMIGADVL